MSRRAVSGREWARAARTPPLCYSATVALAWRVHHDHAREAIFSSIRKLNELKIALADYAVSGPPQKFSNDEEIYEYCAQVWKRSSVQLHRLCEANGIRYYHFLQPNQYVPQSKAPNAREGANVWDQEDAGKIPVEKGYPHLIREGRNLTSAGVAFTDLTMIFIDHPEETYNDTCCHLNKHGNDLLTKKIAEVIRNSRHRENP